MSTNGIYEHLQSTSHFLRFCAGDSFFSSLAAASVYVLTLQVFHCWRKSFKSSTFPVICCLFYFFPFPPGLGPPVFGHAPWAAMGCLHAKSPTGTINHTLDVLITQSHGLKDAAAVELANWMQIVCTQHGLSSFYQKGLSGSVKLEGTRRRLLRDRFESARCVAAAAVQSANKFGLNAPLANEILWAEQHHKPVLLVYDSSKTFDLHLWESSWPPLFQPQPMVTRYFGKGHEACVESFIAQVHHVLSGAQEMPMPASQQKMAEEFESAAVAEKCIVTDEAWEAALHQLRLAQPQDLPKGRFVKGILKKSEQKPKQRPGPDHVFFEETLQEAIRFIVKSLPQVGDEAFLDLLCASVGVSERLVAASLRHLATIPSLQMHELIEEVQMWSLIALRRHGDSVWVVVSNIFYFHPENWGDDPIFDQHFENGLNLPTRCWCLHLCFGMFGRLGRQESKICFQCRSRILGVSNRKFSFVSCLATAWFLLPRTIIGESTSFT